MQKTRTVITTALTALLISFSSHAQTPVEKGLSTITFNSIQGPLKFLSDDKLQGREPGFTGGEIAGDYIASLFQTFGLQPAGEDGSYRQTVDLLVTDNNAAKHTIYIVSENSLGESSVEYKQNIDLITPPVFHSLKIKAPVVFCGYGMADKKFNDLEKLQKEGTALVRIKGYPGEKDSLSKAFKYFSGKDKKEIEKARGEKAKTLGVTAILEYDPGDPYLKSLKAKRTDNVLFANNSEVKHTLTLQAFTQSASNCRATTVKQSLSIPFPNPCLKPCFPVRRK